MAASGRQQDKTSETTAAAQSAQAAKQDPLHGLVAAETAELIAAMIDAAPTMGHRLMQVVVSLRGNSFAQQVLNIAKAKTPPEGQRAVPRAQKPTAAIGSTPKPYQPDDVQRKAGWEQIARAPTRADRAPSEVMLPDSVEKALEKAWQDSIAGGQTTEQGGNLVRTYGGRYELRRQAVEAKPGYTEGTFEPDERDIGWWDTLTAIVHTHPYNEPDSKTKGIDHGTFSGQDLASIIDEEQPLNLLRSGPYTYAISRTKEFNALVKFHENADTKDQLTNAMLKNFDEAFGLDEGDFAAKLEAGVVAVCKKFHLNYYRGQGRNLKLVGSK